MPELDTANSGNKVYTSLAWLTSGVLIDEVILWADAKAPCTRGVDCGMLTDGFLSSRHPDAHQDLFLNILF